jgi:hypothetical protein
VNKLQLDYIRSIVIPTAAQLFTCYVLSHWATKMYLPIYLVTLDEPTQGIFILLEKKRKF